MHWVSRLQAPKLLNVSLLMNVFDQIFNMSHKTSSEAHQYLIVLLIVLFKDLHRKQDF